MVHSQTLDEFAQLYQEVGSAVDVDDGGDDILVVVPLIRVLIVGVNHFINDIGILRRHGLTHLGAGILGAHQPAHLNQTVEGDAVPLPHIGGLPLDLLQLFLGIVDKGGQLVQIGFGNSGSKERVQLFPHHAGGRIQNMQEGLILPVNVRDKVFRALGQVLDGVQVDDLGAGCLDVGVLPGQHLQIVEIFRAVCFFGCHGGASF